MSSRSLRRVLAVTLVAASLSLGGPVLGEAAGSSASSEGASLWSLAWQWLAEAVLSQPVDPAATTEMVEERKDAGWIIDPDG
jgi:hypothetical protein